ncbi:MAG: hypothetical protein JRI68_09060, partial [Deltaproteobacteria bacterium]|nr:hypothetical protein [Deltaproteobacteria bacterium]
MPRSRRFGILSAVVVLAALLLAVTPAGAAPRAKILRIDPRASVVDGAPVLTTVIELVQHKRLADITSKCGYQTGNANMDCVANELERKEALYAPFKFPEDNAIFTVTVDGKDMPASIGSIDRWGQSKNQEGVGTAWLILVDAASSMGNRFEEAKRVALEFINTMGPNDIVNVMFFNDRTVAQDSHWLGKKAAAAAFVNQVTRTYPKVGRTRPLFSIIKQAASDGFSDLGNVGTNVEVPMHQAMVVLSNGTSGADTGSPSQSAMLLRGYLTKGRFPDDNATIPKAPVPIISIWFPARQMEELYQNARQFMENLANTEIGGFHSIVRGGQSGRAAKIVTAVRKRFDQMYIVRWRVPCVAPTIGQTFKLVFKNTTPAVGGDNFVNVPVGIDPSTWPLDLDIPETMAAAKKDKIHPGGTVKIFGNFCWGSDYKRA